MVLEEHRNPRRSRRLAYQRPRLQQGLLMSVILLGTILCLTLGSLLTPDRTYSDSENRKLAQFPKLSWSAVKDGSWFSDLESYTADQFALPRFLDRAAAPLPEAHGAKGIQRRLPLQRRLSYGAARRPPPLAAMNGIWKPSMPLPRATRTCG